MRIQTAADTLLPSPDSGANHPEPAGKQSFARLLQAQPEASAVAPHADENAKVQAAAAPATAADPQPESADAASLATTTTTITAVTPAASGEALARLTATLQLSSKAAVADEPKPAAALAKTLTAAEATEKSAQSAAAKPDSAALDAAAADTVEGDNKPLQLAGKPAPRARLAREAQVHATTTATKPEILATSTESSDANTAALPMTAAAIPANITATADPQTPATTVDNTPTLANQPVAAGFAAAVQSLSNNTTAAPLQQTLQSPEELLLAGNTANSNDPDSGRGFRLPHSGNFLPLTSDSADAVSSRSALPDLFKQLADAASLQNAGQTPDLTAQQTSQILTNAAVTSAQSTPTPAVQQTNAASAPLSSLTTATGTSDNSQASPTALLLSSTLAMHASGWSEETAHHIRWLKDQDLQSAEIQLHPAELGRLSISIDIKDGQASVQLLAGSSDARDLLEKSLPDLRNLLAQSGMSLTDSSVTQHSGGNQTWPNRFNPLWFASDELKPVEPGTGRPALFRSSGGSNRIDQYV
jgi:flagellar hook-length control protein FliK